MNDDLTRLLDSSDSCVREALLPALSDDPGPARMRRAALALGLPITAATLTTTTAAGAVALGAMGKWVAIVGAFGLLCSAVLLTPTANEPVVSRGPTASSVAAAPKPTTTALPRRELEESAEPIPSSAPVPAKIPSARVLAPSASASASDSLALELAALRVARRELAAGNAAEALRALDAYEKASTRHALAAEAMLLRVRALVSSGQQAEARALVARYTRARPNDAYAKKLTELVGGATP